MARRSICAFGMIVSMVVPVAAGAEPNAAVPEIGAREAGARYGQALGVVDICIGAKVTAKGEALRAAYAGADQELFKAQAAKVYDAWYAVKGCGNATDPNQCKIIMDKSCAAAEAEIGAQGSVMPGLVEFPKR